MCEYVCSTPMLLDKEQADSIMMYCPDKIWICDNKDEWVNKDQLSQMIEEGKKTKNKN